MGLKNEVKKTGEGRGLLGIALAVGLGIAVFGPVIGLGWSWLMAKINKPAAPPQGA